MTILRTFVLLACLLAATPAAADEARLRAASELLDAMDMESNFGKMIDASLEAQLAQNPQLVPFRPIFREFLARHMGYRELRPRLTAIYAEEFTAAELAEAKAFYATPLGRKMTRRMPELFAKGALIGQESVQAHLPELVRMLQAEQERRKGDGPSKPGD